MDRSANVDPRRIHRLNERPEYRGAVIYWMSRDQRVKHNWALLHACDRANALEQPVEVLFTLSSTFAGATRRQYDFMLSGLQEVERSLSKIGIPLSVVTGNPGEAAAAFAARREAGVVVTDFSPLKLHRSWKADAARYLQCSFQEVDAHNIVPCRIASPKQEFAARTIRPKLNALRPEFLTSFPEPQPRYQPDAPVYAETAWDWLAESVTNEEPFMIPRWPESGFAAAERQLRQFLQKGLHCYASRRNDPNSGCVSGLSPWLHFGHLSAQQVALEVLQSDASEENRETFIEELFIRRELAENFCFYNDRYDSYEGIPDWAKRTLAEHGDDRRETLYPFSTLERAETGDRLWNAAQRELLERGGIHGYMRMYWAKRILQWTASPQAAFEIALMLNDRYALDGRDPNGYVGIAWAIGGLHDRPWKNRPVFGMIRYMNAAGAARKFDVERYIVSHGASPESGHTTMTML